jgi:hypothetical protein
VQVDAHKQPFDDRQSAKSFPVELEVSLRIHLILDNRNNQDVNTQNHIVGSGSDLGGHAFTSQLEVRKGVVSLSQREGGRSPRTVLSLERIHRWTPHSPNAESGDGATVRAVDRKLSHASGPAC